MTPELIIIRSCTKFCLNSMLPKYGQTIIKPGRETRDYLKSLERIDTLQNVIAGPLQPPTEKSGTQKFSATRFSRTLVIFTD